MVLDTDPALMRDLLRFKPDSLTPNGWAVSAGVSRTVWSDMRRHGNPSRRTLEKLLTAAGSTLAEFEALRIGENLEILEGPGGSLGEVGSQEWRSPRLPPVPLIATELAGEWEAGTRVGQLRIFEDRRIGEVERPASLSRDRAAYALTMVDDAMWPRFRPRRRLLVSPLAPVAIGDDVLVVLLAEPKDLAQTGRMAMVKELVRRTSAFVELRQYNPDAIFRVSSEEIAAIHKVMGEAI